MDSSSYLSNRMFVVNRRVVVYLASCNVRYTERPGYLALYAMLLLLQRSIGRANKNKSLLVAFTSWRREFLTLQIDPGIQMVGQLQADGRRLLLQAFNHLHTASVTWFMASR